MNYVMHNLSRKYSKSREFTQTGIINLFQFTLINRPKHFPVEQNSHLTVANAIDNTFDTVQSRFIPDNDFIAKLQHDVLSPY